MLVETPCTYNLELTLDFLFPLESWGNQDECTRHR